MRIRHFLKALPFSVSIGAIAVAALSAYLGGWWLLLTPVYTWWVMSLLDAIFGLNTQDADPETPDSDLFWHRLVTIVWFPLQFILIFGGIAYARWSDFLQGGDAWWFMVCVGILSGTIGIVYAHELMHQKPKFERILGDALMTIALYGHFRSEHLLVHHRYVGTPKDPVTARYNEGFHRFLPRVLISSAKSSWRAEVQMLARKKLGAFHRSNPFWKYAAFQISYLILAFLIAGWFGVGLFCLQAIVGIVQLEVVNYVEHYGLTRRYLGDGKYEHVMPHHSWNAAHRITNYLLINLQRHSDHHYKPNRRFPLLQNYTADEAPQLPVGYPLMTSAALFPPLWKRIMNKRVKAWRKQYYPDIEDWHAYNKALNPLPK